MPGEAHFLHGRRGCPGRYGSGRGLPPFVKSSWWAMRHHGSLRWEGRQRHWGCTLPGTLSHAAAGNFARFLL